MHNFVKELFKLYVFFKFDVNDNFYDNEEEYLNLNQIFEEEWNKLKQNKEKNVIKFLEIFNDKTPRKLYQNFKKIE